MSQPSIPKPKVSSTRRKPKRRISAPVRASAVIASVVVGVSVIVYLTIGTSSGPHPTANASAAGAGGTAAGTTGGGGSSVAGGGGSGAGTTAGGTAASGGSSSSSNVPKPLHATDAAEVFSWKTGPGGKALARVTTQAGTVLMAHGANQYPEMKMACIALTSAVKAAEAAPSIPDAAMQKTYGLSLTAFKTAAVECQAGITQHQEGLEDTVTDVDSPELNTAVANLGTGMTDLYVATDTLRTLTKKS